MNILQMTFWASVVIMSTVVIRFFALHRIPKNTFLVLWGLALIRLLVPFRFDITLPNHASVLPAITQFNVDYNAVMQDTPMQMILQTDSFSIPWATLIWALVAICLVSYFITSHIRYHKVYKLAVPTDNEYVRGWVRENKLLWRTVKIKVSADISTSLTYGLFHPVILIPKTTDWDDREQLQYILTHEISHIRRFDVLWKWLLMIAMCVHWFNPFMWVMYVLANRDLEITCDEKVVHTLGKNIKANYALTLIGFAERESKIAPLVSAFSKNTIEERITSIMKMRKTSFVGMVIALILVVCVTTILATSVLSSSAELAELPADLDESIQAVIYHENSNGSERLISVSAEDESKYTDDEWKAVLSAVEMGLVKWEEAEINNDGSYVDLSKQDTFITNPDKISDYKLHTNSGQIKISIDGNEYSGKLYLYDTEANSDFIQEITLDSNYPSGAFSSLSNNTYYYVVAKDVDISAMIRITS